MILWYPAKQHTSRKYVHDGDACGREFIWYYLS